MGEKEIVGEKMKMWIGEDGIVRHRFYAGFSIGLEDVQEAFRNRVQLSGGQRHPYLIDISDMKDVSREARVYGTSDEVRALTSAMALVTGSAASRVIGNFYLGINKPRYPTKLYNSEEAAVQWLRGFLASAAGVDGAGH